jgi:hypothetical protein
MNRNASTVDYNISREDTLAEMVKDGWKLAPRLRKDMRMHRMDPTYMEEFTARVRGGTVFTAAFFRDSTSSQREKRAEDMKTRWPRKRARAAEEDEAAVEASPCEPEAAAPEEPEHGEHDEHSEHKKERAQASAAAAAQAMLAVRAAWGGRA